MTAQQNKYTVEFVECCDIVSRWKGSAWDEADALKRAIKARRKVGWTRGQKDRFIRVTPVACKR